MRRIERILGSQKGWSQPPFWSAQAPTMYSVETGEKERIEADFTSYVRAAYKANGVVFAVMLVRQLIFSEARFLWQKLEDGRPTTMFSNADLSILERPWRNGTTGELLARMEQDASIAGNFYATPVGTGAQQRIRRLRPDWVTIVTGSPSDDPFDIEAEPIGIIYEPKHGLNSLPPVFLTPDQVVHYSPIPDPEAQWRGMSWLTPILREIEGDSAATKHKLKFFEQGAIPGLVVTYSKEVSAEAFTQFVKQFASKHEGTNRAYKTLHLGGGADAKSLGADLKQLDFKTTQGVNETRIAAAGGVHPVVVGLSEGLEGSSLNAGNFSSARRSTADRTLRPLWRIAAASLESILKVPDGSRLWYDDRDVAFLREDAKDDAEILNKDATTITALVNAGFTPDEVIAAVAAKDLRRLAGSHSGLFSVQLQPSGSELPPAPAP